MFEAISMARRAGATALAFVLVGGAAVGSSGCSFTELAANGTVDVMWEGSPALAEENDPELAEAGLVGNLKLMEGLMRVVPDNPLLFRMGAEAFSSYAFGFLEPRLWPMDSLSPEYAAKLARVKLMYERAIQYARRNLELRLPDVNAAIGKGPEALAKALNEDFDEEEIDAIFWVAQTMGQLVGADPEDLESVAILGTAEQLMKRVVKSRPNHEDGTGYIFLGTNVAVMGPGLGGDMSRAKEAFDKAIAATDGKYLLARFMYGRFYCVAISDRACFESELKKVREADPSALLRRRLTNILAQGWAEYWLAHADDLF